MVIKKDGLLVSVTIPPFVLGLKIDVGVMLAGISGLSNSGRTVNPDPADIFGDVRLGSGDLIGVYVLFKLKVSVETDKPLCHGFLCSDLE